MKRFKFLSMLLLVSSLVLGVGLIANNTGATKNLLGSTKDDNYSILLNKDNYATVEEVGTFVNPILGDKLATRKTGLGNDIVLQFCSNKGVTNNDGTSPTKFCQMPASWYGWVTNKTPLTGIKKVKLTVQQSSAVFRFDLSNSSTLENYYYDAEKPSYVTFRSEEYTGSTSYEVSFSGSYNYLRLQNLSGALSLVSLEIFYSCKAEVIRGELRMNATSIPLSKPITVSQGGTIVVDYKYVDPITDKNNGVSLFFGSDETNRFGNYKIFFDRLETTYNGIAFSTLEDGYNRLTVDVSLLDKVRSEYTAPTTISEISFKWFEVTKGVYFDVNPKKEKVTEFQMSGSEFVIANFTDIHVTEESFLSDTGTVGKTIKYGIEHSNPDIMVFSGDVAGKAADLDYIFDYLDGFKIPYFLILGNHDHEGSLGYDTIAQHIANSEYGYIEKGPTDLASQGNYTVKIKNSSGNLVHGLVLMDTGNKYTVTDDSLVEYVKNPISGVKYGTYNTKKTYCVPGWNGLRGNQIDWYEDKVTELGCETTLFCHIPCLEFVKAFEQYQDAVNKSDASAIAACAPIGKCVMGEESCGSMENLGLFDSIKNKGSTKTVICGHDHVNAFSLLYQGVRLTYSVKCGEGSYWKTDGSICGYTELSINSSGQASLDQIFYNPLTT